jgi:pimeloyl-ACP methyl ester carboxylesterase
MNCSKFSFSNRGKKETILLVPGWASDWKIFNTLNLEYNYLIPTEFSPFNFKDSLVYKLQEENLNKLTILGWSLGGFAAVDFACQFPHFVNKIFLVSVRKKYPKENLENIGRFIKKDKKAYLYRFYHECFSPNEEGFFWFKKNLLKLYLEEINLDYLLEGLDYLSRSELNLDVLKNMNVKLLHGEEDKIAPFEEVLKIKNGLPDADLISIKGTGHIPFLNPGFEEKLS